MGGRAVEGTGLENRQGLTLLVGSNPTPSAISKEWGMGGLANPVAQIRKPKLPPGRDRRLEDGEEDRLMEAGRAYRSQDPCNAQALYARTGGRPSA